MINVTISAGELGAILYHCQDAEAAVFTLDRYSVTVTDSGEGFLIESENGVKCSIKATEDEMEDIVFLQSYPEMREVA